MSKNKEANNEINFDLMNEKISDWKKDIQDNEKLMSSLKDLADK